MDEPIQVDIKVETEEILFQDYQRNINSLNIQQEALETNKQGAMYGAKDFESISELSSNYCDVNNDNYDDYDDDDEEHECTLCERLFQSQKIFKAHIKEHAKLDGLLSDSGGEEKFQTIKDPEMKNADHQSISSSAYMHTNAKESPYKCLHCPKEFTTKHQFQNHMNRHKIGRPYICEICSKSFSYRSQLEVHKRTHTGERPYECDQCSKTFKNTDHLKKHMYRHTGDHPYKCEICLTKCSELSKYKAHMRIHTGERPFKCEICSKTFKSTAEVTSHIRIHTDERPYECDQCSKTFKWTVELTRHKRIHSGERHFKCETRSALKAEYEKKRNETFKFISYITVQRAKRNTKQKQ